MNSLYGVDNSKKTITKKMVLYLRKTEKNSIFGEVTLNQGILLLVCEVFQRIYSLWMFNISVIAHLYQREDVYN